jgi:hypothetical protein
LNPGKALNDGIERNQHRAPLRYRQLLAQSGRSLKDQLQKCTKAPATQSPHWCCIDASYHEKKCTMQL